MKLRRFNYKLKENKKKPLIISGLLIMVLLIGITIYSTYAEYKVTDSYNIIEGEVDFFEKRDLTVAVKLVDSDGNVTYVEEIPTEGYTFDAERSYCINGSTISFNDGKVAVSDIVGKEKCTVYFKQLTTPSLYEAILANNTLVTTTPDFSVAATDENTNIYQAPDDLGTSYYFRGAVTNNYVKFGTYAAGSTVNGVTYNEETPMYWRIVRINGDGSIRLIYDGTTPVANGIKHTAYIGNTKYNENADDAKYLGYTYEGTDDAGETVQVDSTIKGVVDDWYEEHLKDNYDEYIADGIFCNDKVVSSTYNEMIFYSPSGRLSSATPLLTCTNKEDRYTMADITNGNGLLSNPVGLITADEAMYAGSLYQTDISSYYLYSGYTLWTLTVDRFTASGSTMWGVNDKGGLYVSYTTTKPYARPVINLKADVKIIGNGTIETPYEIITE